jgi:hypothetical protein
MNRTLVRAIKDILRARGESPNFLQWCERTGSHRKTWYRKRQETPPERAARLLGVLTSEVYRRMEGGK